MRLEIDKVLKRYNIRGMTPTAPFIDETSLPLSEMPPKMFITGAGSLMNVHFSGAEKSFLEELFWNHMLQNGIYLAQRGFVALNIEISASNVEEFVEAINSFCERWQQFLAST